LAFVDYSSELMGTIPKLSYLLAQKHVNRAWKKIRDSRHWSFLMLDTDIIMPSAVGAGTASVTQYTASVQFDATAKAALLNLANPVITKRQFRVAQGPVYSITAYDNLTGIATLDRLYIQATEAAATYMVYQCYYEAPVADFMRFVTVRDPNNGWWLRLRTTMTELNKRDPWRGALGNPPRNIVPYKADLATGLQLFELWPAPTSQGVLQCLIQRSGTDFVDDTDTLPPQVSEDALMCVARQLGFEWAMANVGRYPELKGVGWQFLITEQMARYKELINADRLKDEEAFQQNWTIPDDSSCFLGPMGGSYAQSHDVDVIY
jgi:hypothetical protein